MALIGMLPLLPQMGDFQTLTRSKILQAALLLRSEEASERGLAFVGDNIIDTNDSGEINNATEVPMNDKQYEFMVNALKGAEMTGSLTMPLYDLYMKLVHTPNDEALREVSTSNPRVLE